MFGSFNIVHYNILHLSTCCCHCSNALDVAYPEQEEERRLLLPGTPLHPPSPDNTQPFLLVAITSACCSLTSLQRRNAIRSTWGALSKERYPTEIDIKFFLAQPPNTTIAVRWRTPLGEELSSLSASLTPPTPDLVIVRGKDTYKNLPNKTFRVMRYALAHPYNYSFVLKVDDDTHVRMHKVLQSLQELHLYQVSQRQITLEWMQGVKEELKKMSQEQHRAVISDGMGLFYSTQDTADGEHVVGDTIDGQQVTVNDLLLNITHEHEHEHALTPDGSNTSTTTTPITKQNAYPQSNVYMGCIEVRGGYRPIRDPGSKWYVSPTTLPDDSLPRGIEYLAGWGYLLSRDLVNHIVQKVNTYHDASSPHATTDTRSSVNTTHGPLWFYELPWEDVVVGFLLSNVVPRPLSHPAFRPAWRLCSPDTAVRHLDIDSPRLLAGLMEQDRSGLSDEKTVQCSSGEFLPGDYHGWWRWRQAQERFSSERVHGHRR